jgi:hypothetical protein
MKVTFQFDVADIPSEITPEMLAEHKRRAMAHFEATIDAHHEQLVKDHDERKKKALRGPDAGGN